MFTGESSKSQIHDRNLCSSGSFFRSMFPSVSSVSSVVKSWCGEFLIDVSGSIPHDEHENLRWLRYPD
jgi:hypothetical protein